MKTFSNVIIENNIEKQKISYEKHRRFEYKIHLTKETKVSYHF